VNFNISYGDGEFLTGNFGYEKVTLAGITVKKQQIAVVDAACWEGDGISAGLIGLAYPGLTKSFAGNDPTVDTSSSQILYNPIFTSMYNDGLIAPLFSLAMERGASGGFLAMGGLPPVKFVPKFGSAPLQILTASAEAATAAGATPRYLWYVITIDGFSYSGSKRTQYSTGKWSSPLKKPTNETQIQVLVDRGTNYYIVPTAISDAVNGLFSPPAVYSDNYGAYVVDCDAKTPKLE
jgi:Eukaryotic aspartyl protease